MGRVGEYTLWPKNTVSTVHTIRKTGILSSNVPYAGGIYIQS